MVAGGEQSGYGILTVREQLWMFSQFYGLGTREGWRRVDELIEAVGPRRAAAPARQHAVHRPAPEDELGPRPAQRPVDPVPRRADAGPRRRRRPRRSASSSSTGRPPSRAGRSCSRPTTWPRRTSCASGSRSSTTAGSSPSARPTSSRGASSASRSSGSSSTASTAGIGRARRGCPGVVSAAPAADDADPERQRVAVNLVLEEDARAGRRRHRARPASARHILALRKSEPTLEDVFVELVGRGFGDEGEPRATATRRERTRGATTCRRPSADEAEAADPVEAGR